MSSDLFKNGTYKLFHKQIIDIFNIFLYKQDFPLCYIIRDTGDYFSNK